MAHSKLIALGNGLASRTHAYLQDFWSIPVMGLNGSPIYPSLLELNKNALKLATVGACIGVLGSYLGREREPASAASARESWYLGSKRRRARSALVAYGALGGAIGFAASIGWGSSAFAQTIARTAIRNFVAARDQRWLKSHPINYA